MCLVARSDPSVRVFGKVVYPLLQPQPSTSVPLPSTTSRNLPPLASLALPLEFHANFSCLSAVVPVLVVVVEWQQTIIAQEEATPLQSW